MKKSPRKSRFIDIYFVLYLAALVLLIPDKNAGTDDATRLITSFLQSSFTIHLERSVLLCRAVRSGDSISILSFDAETGIYHSGAMKDVRYEFEIDDQSFKTSYAINSMTVPSASFFTLRGSPEQGGVTFAWKPPVQERQNRLFRVTVKASATPVLPETMDETARNEFMRVAGNPDNLRVHARSQFTVALVFVDGGTSSMPPSSVLASTPSSDTDTALARRYEELLRQFNQPRPAPAPQGDFYLQPRENIVRMIAFQPFENRIRVYGADAAREVDGIRVSGGNAYARVEGSDLVITGTAPSSGSTYYTVSARRTADKKDTTVSFRVFANPLDPPLLPSFMYPGISYVFQPRLPDVSGVPAGAVLRDDRGSEVVRSSQGESFAYTPRVEDTLRTFSFERLLNDRKIGQSYAVTVQPFPVPEIIDVTLRGTNVWVRTRAFGPSGDARSRVRIDLGNSGIRVQERLGDWSYDEQTHAHLQVFQFPAPVSSVQVRAVNGRKQSSERRDYAPR